MIIPTDYPEGCEAMIRDADNTETLAYVVNAQDAPLYDAAPALLEALRDLMAALTDAGLDTMPGDTMADIREAAKDARAAISRAEGTP